MRRTLIRIKDTEGNELRLTENLGVSVIGSREALRDRAAAWLDELAIGTFDGQHFEAEDGSGRSITFSVTGFELTMAARDFSELLD